MIYFTVREEQVIHSIGLYIQVLNEINGLNRPPVSHVSVNIADIGYFLIMHHLLG